MLNLNDLKKKPEIDFPCEWSYKIIGSDHTALKMAIEEILGNYPYRITKTTKSSKGNYISLTVKLTVFSSSEMDSHYKRLSADKAIRLVL